MSDPTPKVNSRYGAPMGRFGLKLQDTGERFLLRHCPLNAGGYDTGGAYWGIGQRLYIECPRCRGEGWLLQRAPRLGPGLYEVTCEHCNGHGAVAVDAEDEVEDWMRDE